MYQNCKKIVIIKYVIIIERGEKIRIIRYYYY